jgi:hypothetical protein
MHGLVRPLADQGPWAPLVEYAVILKVQMQPQITITKPQCDGIDRGRRGQELGLCSSLRGYVRVAF